MKIEFSNYQKIKKINFRKLKKYFRKLSKILNLPDKEISIIFGDNNFIKKINKTFLKKNYPTDVISFPLLDNFYPNYLGEVIVSVEKAISYSRIYKADWKEELFLYIIHGILHLLGYRDDNPKNRKIMQTKEKEIIENLKPVYF